MKCMISSLSFLNNKKTILSYFVILPILNVLFIAVINYQFTRSLSDTVIISTIIISACLQTISAFNMSFVYDCNMKIDKYVISNNYKSFYYWSRKAFISFLVGAIIIVINLFLYSLILKEIPSIKIVITVSILLLIYSIIISFVASVLSWRLQNPYFFLNVFLSFTMLLSGVIINVEYYPPMIKYLTKLLPFANTVSLIKNENSNYMYDLVLAITWLVIGIIIYRIQIRRNLSKKC